MKKLTFWKSLFLLCALVVGTSTSWAEDVTRTENFASSAATSNNYDCNSGISTTANQADWDYAWTPSGSGTVFKSGIKLGSKNTTGSVTNTTMLTNIPTGTSVTIKIYAARWNSDSGNLTVTYNGDSESKAPSNSAITSTGNTYSSSDFSTSTNFTITKIEDVTSFTIASSAKRILIDKVEVTYTTGGGSTPSSEATFTTKEPSISYPATKTYSQVPTTAAGYEGTITYEITANTAGATINPSSGLVTVTKGGSVTVKATAEAVSGSFTSSSDTYTLTVNDTRASAGLAWSAESANVQYGADNNVFPTLTNTHSVPVTYQSSSQAAATIDANTGEITLKDYTGKTTISAIFAGNDDYYGETVTYELNVTKAPFVIKDGVFDFVEAGAQSTLVDYGSGVTIENDGQTYVYDNSTWTAGNVTMVASGKYRWWYNGKDLRFYNNTDNQSKITLSVPSGYVITKVVFNGGSSFSVSSGELSSTTSGTWTGAANIVAFTYNASSSQNVKSLTVTYTTANQTFTPAKTYTTLTSAYNLDFTSVSNDLKAFIAVNGISGTTVKMTQVNKVPAGTGLVLKATTPGAAVTVPVFDGTEADNVSGNMMAGSATETTAIAANGGYILKDGVFQPANAGTLAAGKAYLAIAVSSARSLEMSFEDTTTGINGVEEIAPVTKTRKVVKNGRLVIETANGEFTIDGARMK